MFKFLVVTSALIGIAVAAPSPTGLFGGGLSSTYSLSLGAQHSSSLNKNNEHSFGKSYGGEEQKSFAGGFGGSIQHSKETTLKSSFEGGVGAGFAGGVGDEIQHLHASKESKSVVGLASSKLQNSVGAGYTGKSGSYGGLLSAGEVHVTSGSGYNGEAKKAYNKNLVGGAQQSFNSEQESATNGFGGSISQSHVSGSGIGGGIQHSSSITGSHQHSIGGEFGAGIQHSSHGLGILSGIKEGIHNGIGHANNIADSFSGSFSGGISGGLFK